MATEEPRITVGELLDYLSKFDRKLEVSFSGLDFYRLKQRSPTCVQVEFNQLVYRKKEGEVVVENHDV